MYNVYLISCEVGDSKRYKIGYTRNSVEKRIKQLKTGNSNDLFLEKVFVSKWGSKIEAILHRKFSQYKISGEWFDLNQQQLDFFENDCKNLELYFEQTINNSTFKNPKTFLI